VRRKLTNRERLLIIIAAICLAAVILYYSVFKPQLEAVSKLEQQAKGYSIILKDIEAKANINNPIYIENQLLYEKTQALLKRYYPAIVQENIILLLNEKLKKANLNVVSMAFSEPGLSDMEKEETAELPQISELEDLVRQLYSNKLPEIKPAEKKEIPEEETVNIYKMTAALSLRGSYNQIYSFLADIESENRSITVRELHMADNFNNVLTCDLTLDFYSVPKPFEQDGDVFEWSIEGVYGKENPF
jgi:Tfp pilus assembly protein PilO